MSAALGLAGGLFVGGDGRRMIRRAAISVLVAVVAGYVVAMTGLVSWSARCPDCHVGSEGSDFTRSNVLALWAVALGIPLVALVCSFLFGVKAASGVTDPDEMPWVFRLPHPVEKVSECGERRPAITGGGAITPRGLSLKRCIGGTLVVAFSAPLFWFGVRAAEDAWTCRRGEECIGPFAVYLALGVPALLIACGFVLIGVLLCLPIRQRTVVGWTWAVASVVAVVLLSVALWNK